MTETATAASAEHPAATRSAEFLTLTRFAVGLAVLVAVAFTDVVFGWRSFFTRDFTSLWCGFGNRPCSIALGRHCNDRLLKAP